MEKKYKKIILITAPSGSGKTSIVNHLMKKFPQLSFSVSATTRQPRRGEQNGVDYYFISEAEFREKIHDKEFLEWEMVYEGKYYGTLKSDIERIWKENKIPVLDIDVQGAIHVQQQYPVNTIAIFIQPPSTEELKRRLKLRGSETDQSLQARLNKSGYEMTFKVHFENIIINENFEKAYSLSPGNEEVIKELTYLAFNNHQYQKAIDFCLKCKKCTDADRILGISFYHLEDYAKSANYLAKFVLINDKDAEAAYVLGRSYLELENEKQAMTQFKNAITLDPKKNKWMNELGLIYYNQEDYKNALLYFNMASENGFNKTNDFYENYGFAQIYTGDSKNGIETLKTILERKPNNTELLRNMAHALYSIKDYQSSLSYFERLLKINEKDASALFMAGMIFQKTGQKEKGQKICDKAIELDPSLARNRQKKEMPMGL